MGSSSIDNNGFRRQRANPISRVGVFPYRGDEIDYDDEFGLEKDKFYWVLRGPDELFSPEAIETFQGLPIRCGHVMLGEKPKTMADNAKTKEIYKKVGGDNTIDGCIYNVRPSLDNPGYLIAEFCIYTDRMKNILKEGKIKELSLGYVCRYEREDGVFMGMPYQFKQVGLKGNHLALVKHGRCGSSVCVCDSAPDGAPVVVTFDSLPEGIIPMEEKKQEDKKLERAKALAAKIKGGDEQLALDCLDFADCSPEDRKAFLDSRKKGKKDKDEKPVKDKAVKCAKDDEPPTPPDVPNEGDEEEADGEEKANEAGAPAASAASAPADSSDAPDNPPTDVPSPKDGEDPATGDEPAKDCKAKSGKGCKAAKDAIPEKECDKDDKECKDEAKKDCKADDKDCAPAKDCGTAKDCGVAKDACPTQGATAPSIPTPVGALQGDDEKKDDDKKADKPAKDKAPERDCQDKACECKGKGCTCDEAEEVEAEGEESEEVKDDDAEAKEKVVLKEKEKATKDSLGPGKTPTLGKEPTPALGAEKTDEPKDPEKYVEPNKPDKIAQDEYAAFAVEYANAQALANSIRPHVKVAFDSTTMREIDVARFAAKHIPSLAFVMDEANDAIVLAAVRGHIAAFCAKPEAVAQDEATKDAPAEPEKVETEVPVMDKSIFEDFIPGTPMETGPSPEATPDAMKALRAYLGN